MQAQQALAVLQAPHAAQLMHSHALQAQVEQHQQQQLAYRVL
jgi:hypothetical protein